MLRFFRINDPYRLIFIFFILAGVRLFQSYFIEGRSMLELKWLVLGDWLGDGYRMYGETYDYTGPLAAFVYKYLDIFFGRSIAAHQVFSSLLIIVQAAIFNRILLRNRAFDENSYLPAFLYVLVFLSIPDFMALSPQLMSMTFVLMTLGNVLRRIDNQATDELFLNSGIFVGIASMIYMPSIVFLLVFLVSLIIFSSATTRRLLMYLFGFLLVTASCMAYFYWVGDYSYFVDFYLIRNLFLKAEWLLGDKELLIISIPLVLVLLLSIFKTVSSARLTHFQQRVQQVIWFMFFGAVASFLITNRKSAAELIFVIPLIAYFLNHYFILLRNRLFKFIMPGLVIFGLIAYNIYIYQSVLSPLEGGKGEKNQRILVLGENVEYYLNKKASSPCFSRPLCEKAFEGLAFYQPSTAIFEWLDSLSPEIIVDEMGVVPELFHRFPFLEKSYEKDGDGNYVRINN